jgi:hypothetical protein
MLRVLGGLLLAIAALGLLAFAAETILAALEGEATTPSLFALGVAVVVALWCARTSWRLVVGRTRSTRD